MLTNNQIDFSLLFESKPFNEIMATQLLHTGAVVLAEDQWSSIFNRYKNQQLQQSYIFLAACSLGQKNIVKNMLQENPFLISSVDSEGNNAFLIAAINDQILFAKWLLDENYCHHEVKDKLGKTAFISAVIHGKMHFAIWLLDNNLAKPDEINYILSRIKYIASDNSGSKDITIITHFLLTLKRYDLLEQLLIKPITIKHLQLKQLLVKNLEEHFNNLIKALEFDECLKIAKIAKDNKVLSPTLISQLFTSITNQIFSFKNEKGETVTPSEEDIKDAFKQWDILTHACKNIDLPITLLCDADLADRYGQFDRAFNDYTDILDNPNSTSDIKQRASLSVAELLMMGKISLENTVFPAGLAVEDRPPITPNDLPATVAEKNRKTEDILIARAIQAYEYIFNYRDSDLGKRLITRFNLMMAGKDTVQNEKPKWLLRASLLYSEYYSPQTEKEIYKNEMQKKHALEKAHKTVDLHDKSSENNSPSNSTMKNP